ncbi:MAG: CheR family methyltransferase, partial [Balneolales bacterium]
MNKPKSKSNNDLVIVAIGSSAGGLDALSKLLSNLPEEMQNVAFVIAQYHSPTHESHLVDLLSKKTSIPVLPVSDGTAIMPGHIYVTPRDREVTLEKDTFVLAQQSASSGPKPSIDHLFRSLAAGRDINIIGIVLSGSSEDGAEGIRAIKQADGYTIAQEPQTAEYDRMPIAVIDSGFVDYVLTPEEMGEQINEMADDLLRLNNHLVKNVAKNEVLDEIFELLSKRTQTSFENYKPSTIYRRLHKRLAKLNVHSFEEYLALVKKKPSEMDALFDTILIGVTAFFRDRESFEQLEKQLKKLITSKAKGDSIRVWVPGCSSGEEAYSIAIILHRLLKGNISRYNIQIFATDIDERGLAAGRRGVYSEEALKEVDPAIVHNYFTKKGSEYAVNKSVRSLVLFSKHDVTVHPPFLRLDLISCRNLFIYFGNGLQKQILPIFHYALNADGYLFMGKAETVGTFTDLFAVVDARHKLYKRKKGNRVNALRFGNFKPHRFGKFKAPGETKDTSITGMVKDTLYKAYPHPYVVINEDHNILKTKGDVHHFLRLPEGDMNTNIFRMTHDSLQIDLRTIVSEVAKEKTFAASKVREVVMDGQTWNVRLTAQPIVDGRMDKKLYLVSFEKQQPEVKTVHKNPVSDGAHERVVELEQELSATKENMQRYIEDLETANEELQSLNEEMQSTGEELHTSNEELESTNEELQSSYDEIQRGYEDLRSSNRALEKKEAQLRESESNTKALLNNTLQSFVLIDRQYKIITFNETARNSYKKMLGKEIKPAKSFIDFITAENAETFRNDLDKVFEG